MVDVTEAIESKYVGVQFVRNSPTKKLVILGEGGFEETNFENEGKKQKITLPVEIDGKHKSYRPTKDSIKNLSDSWGKDTKMWTGKIAKLSIITIAGKECVLAQPA